MTNMTGGLFPPSPRVFYTKAPLVQVIGQVRFPPILRIERDAPAEFQDLIRNEFPLFERANPLMIQPLPQEIMNAFGSGSGISVYNFLTEDRRTAIELTPQSMGLTSQSYLLWEQFFERMGVALAAFQNIYNPAFYTRVGLRYQNLIDRKKIEFEQVPWSRLLRQEILGELAIKEFEDNVLGANRLLHVKMPSGAGAMLLRHGFGMVPGQDQVGYVIDFDFSTEQKTEVADVRPVLSRLHDEVGRAFRWSITPKLHEALGPTAVDPA
jgi:uncharacterized protein (TIGR04255 family)